VEDTKIPSRARRTTPDAQRLGGFESLRVLPDSGARGIPGGPALATQGLSRASQG